MAVKNNPIKYLQNDGWVITSDPDKYYKSYNPNRGKKPWGQRDHFEYGINVDSYCGGKHPALDMVKWHNAPIKSFANATVLRGTGWNTFGWTTVLGFIDHNGIKRQVILGHLNSNPLNFLKIGQNVKVGDIVGYQGASNNLGVTMASHLHIQFQNYEFLGEWAFTCTGIEPRNIDITTTKPTSGSKVSSNKVASKPKASSQPKTVTVKRETPDNFNKRKGRKTRNKAYAKGVIRSTNGRGAALRRFSGGAFTNTFGPDLPDGSIVYIFATTDTGWAKVYSPQNKGWVHLDQVRLTEVY